MLLFWEPTNISGENDAWNLKISFSQNGAFSVDVNPRGGSSRRPFDPTTEAKLTWVECWCAVGLPATPGGGETKLGGLKFERKCLED